MTGIIIPPMAAAVAGAEPLIAPKKVQATIETMASPPGNFLRKILHSLISLSDTPPLLIREPLIMKNGIAISVKESTPVKKRCTTNISGKSEPNATEKKEAPPMAYARGIPVIINATSVINKIADICLTPLPYSVSGYPARTGSDSAGF